MPQTWLITGGSNGIGLALTRNCLKRGLKVIATARNVPQAKAANPDVEQAGGTWIELDVNDGATESIVKDVVEREDVDCIVNNAAYSHLGVVEDSSDADVQAQMDTNLHGPLRVIRGALPHLRNNRAGLIINVSSAAGIRGQAGMGLYSASKFALEGVSESLSRELAAFNIKVLLVDLGAFRTNFASTAKFNERSSPSHGGNGRVSEPYTGTAADQNLQRIESLPRTAPNDANKAAAAIVDAAQGEGKGQELAGHLRLALGTDCLTVCRAKEKELSANFDATEALARSVAIDSS